MSKKEQVIKILAHCFSGVVLSENTGTWQLYSNGIDFQEGKEIATQRVNESFKNFILRSARIIMENEKDKDERIFTEGVEMYCPDFWREVQQNKQL